MELNFYHHILDRSICPRCPDTSGRHNFEQRHTEVDGVVGDYYICEYCGKSAGEVLPDAYTAMVGSLPATVITDDGRLIWKPEISELLDSPVSTVEDVTVSAGLPVTKNGVTVSGFGRGRRVLTVEDRRGGRYYDHGVTLYFAAPVKGAYTRLASEFANLTVWKDDEDYTVSESYTEWNAGTLYAGDRILVSAYFNLDPAYDQYDRLNGAFYFPEIEIIPDSLPADGDYSAAFRPAAVSGDYSVVSDGGVVTHDEPIFNETQGTLYNPVTGETFEGNSWTYDYGTRTYTVQGDNGDVSSVTYGDDNITINDGGNTFNIYYGTVNQGGNSGRDSGNSDSSNSGIFGKIGDLIGSLFSGVLDILSRVLGKVLDALTGLVELGPV